MRYKDGTATVEQTFYPVPTMEHTDHILIVDDDLEIRELLASYLEKQGMRASTAANGRQMRALIAVTAIGTSCRVCSRC